MVDKKLNVDKVPNLRFKLKNNIDFPEWEFKELGNIGEIINGLTYSPSDIDEAGILVLRSSNIQNRNLSFEDNVYVKTDSYNAVQENDILICVRNGSKNLIGKNALINKENEGVAFGAFMSVYRSPFNKFLFHWFDTNEYKKIVHKNLGATINSINGSDLKKFKVPFPSVDEQKKMASLFSRIEERIHTQNKIIEGLTLLKKGMAQRIFSQKMRFKDDKGNDFPDWSFKSLGEILEYEQPTNYLVSSTEYDNRYKTPVVTAGKTFILGYTNEMDGIFEKEKLPVIIFDDFTTASQFVSFQFKAKSSAMKILRAKDENNTKFIFEAMQLINYEIGGHGRHWISVFSEMEIQIPSPPEQQKIANFLSSIDNKIEVETEVLRKLEEQKKYLLQNMFV